MNKKPGEPLRLVSVPTEDNPSEAVNSPKTVPASPSDNDKVHTLPSTHGQDPGLAEGEEKLLNSRFELLEILGKGNFCTVYKSIDRIKSAANSDYFVTIKILQRKFQTKENWISFESLLSRYHQLDHPNISRVYGLSQVGATGFLRTEYLSGASLGQGIRNSSEIRMPPGQALNIINEIGRALIFAHQQGIVHGDLKPANVFLCDSGEAKVLDFGLALTLRSTAKDKADAPHFGPNNYSASSPSYASPEQLDLRKPEPSDDVYALACITYEMLAGQHPFGRVRATGAQEFGLKLKPSDAFTETQWDSLQKALAFDRDQRTATVSEFLAGFTPSESSSSGLNSPGINWVRWASVAAGVLAFVIVAVFILQQEITNEDETSENPSVTAKLTPPQAPVVTDVPVVEQSEMFVLIEQGLTAITEKLRQKNKDDAVIDSIENKPPDISDQSRGVGATSAIPQQQTPNTTGRQVPDLLLVAQNQLAARRLTLPAGNNALETYREILRLEPEQAAAKQGILSIKQRYIQLSQAASNRGEWAKAKAFVQRSASIEPKESAAALLEMLRLLESRQVEQKTLIQPAKDSQVSPKTQLAKIQAPITRPSVELAQITDVKHELIADFGSPVATIQAQISGAVNQAQVFVNTGDGYQSHRLYDDGSHGDQTSGDGEFYAVVNLGNHRRDTHYYVTATMDTGVSVSSPAGAEKEAYLIKPPPGTLQQAIVINEFMASNNQTIADSLGGYDDWIELYNRSQQMIDLSGIYLSNNPQKPKQWKFPAGSKIGANSYLIIWADRSSSSTNMTSNPPEIHTNFMLSRQGGQILLVESDRNGNRVIDSITFKRQREDQTMGRYPDGLGEFGDRRTSPTPGRVNSNQ